MSSRNPVYKSLSRVRVTDVAKLTGCAPSTVSNVINYPDKVSPKKRVQIKKAMLELGYVRNYAARALRSQRSHMVGVLIPTLNFALYASLVDSVNHCFSDAGISTLIGTFDYNLETEFQEARLLLERGAEGLILIGQLHKRKLYDMLKQFNVPFVNTYVSDTDSAYPSVGFDNAKAAGSITRYLVQLGHTKFCVISGVNKDNDRTSNRVRGVRTELKRHGIELNSSMVVERSYSITSGREGCAILLSRVQPRPTAIVCGNDVLALGAMIECEARGLKVPDDISIVGFDNFEFAMYTKPPLTTVDVPAKEMGHSAAHYLLNKLNGQELPLHVSVDVQFILRKSTAPPQQSCS